VPVPIGQWHKFLTAGTSHGASGGVAAPAATTNAPAGPSVAELGASAPSPSPSTPAPSADPPAPVLYIPPALHAPGISTDLPIAPCTAPDVTAPRAALGTPSPPASTAAPAGLDSPRQLYIPLALRAGSVSSAPRGPLPGFVPLRLEHVLSHTTTRAGLVHLRLRLCPHQQLLRYLH
jgi:hypothetical protein